LFNTGANAVEVRRGVAQSVARALLEEIEA
jgi:hypothetical protein